MFRSLLIPVSGSPLGRWCCLATLVVCLGLSGCTSPSLRGDGFPEDDLSTWAGRMRLADELGQSHAYSNKARQIDRNLGGP